VVYAAAATTGYYLIALQAVTTRFNVMVRTSLPLARQLVIETVDSDASENRSHFVTGLAHRIRFQKVET
jgi:hypothetical protein